MLRRILGPLGVTSVVALAALPANAQNFRFTLRAEPDVIPANGISTTSIFVQVPQSNSAISPNSQVRFATTAGTIESQAILSGGVARVLLRSSTKAETASITAFVGAARETITVEFTEDTGLQERYMEVAAPYVAYSSDYSVITSSGKSSIDFGDLHFESDVRLDVDLETERVWAQGTKNGVIIRNGKGGKKVELRGDRLFYDLRRRRGVIRRSEGDDSLGSNASRQEFVGVKFEPPSDQDKDKPEDSKNTKGGAKSDPPAFVSPPQAPTSSPQGRENLTDAPAPIVPPIEEQKPADGSAGNTPSPDNTTEPATENPAPITVAPGSLADRPAPLKNGTGTPETVANPLALPGRPEGGGDAPAPANVPDYKPLPTENIKDPHIVELPPPSFNVSNGYWVTARRLRVFPRDKVQFEKASVYFNGKKAFGAPVYVLPLDGSFNPTTDMFAFNSAGGPSVNFPFYYQATKGGTGAVFLRREPGNGFGTQEAGFSLALQQQYWLNPKSHGDFDIDQIGRGDFNVNFSHQQQLDGRTNASFYLNSPRHKDLYMTGKVTRDLSAMQIGFETFFDRPENEDGNLRGTFFAKMRPRTLGKSGWSYSLSANVLAVQRVGNTVTVGSSTGGGGGINIGDGVNTGVSTFTQYRSLVGQTMSASFQSPTYSPWRGSSFNANLLTTAFNYSDGRRGFAPGANLSFSQSLGRGTTVQLNYTYDRASLGLYGSTSNSYTHYVSLGLNSNVTSKMVASAFASKSLSDGSLYGSAGLDYYFAPKWRAGLFTDYANFTTVNGGALNYGWSLGREVAGRELSINYDANRQKIYFLFGNGLY